MPYFRTFYMRDMTKLLVDERGTNVSAIINRDLLRYYDVLRRSLPTFTESEAMLIYKAMSRALATDVSYNGVPLLWGLVADYLGGGAAEHSDLVSRLRGLNAGAAAAVVDAVERARMLPLPAAEALRKVGLVE